MANTLTPKELAQRFDSDARTVRKFLRSEIGTVGKGQRWAIEAKQVRSLKAKFAKWDDARKTNDTPDEVETDESTD